ncbi:quinol:cytochrome c oxidoreductase pentaheme cytochrome subunit [Dyadobacter koreensis]|uniref:Quinol:cytochrome c oxidoreductase pentaheme cytochrome subunit n=1 Tax=Dyadobacter koreensis TaxID=408657 RepID=A0A1H6ZKU4_9BACT|nr:c-type cytochrome [Dyadobacter koreensis]SEJ54021.1 quinol:cytochrome c oxidoreductase pentaheme cytochrome subunit [Dyadobacter koreensis]
MNIPFREDSKFCSFFPRSKSFLAIFVAILLSTCSLAWAQDSTAAAGAAPAAAAGGGDAAKGEALFKNNCAQCHAVTDEKVVGPGLKGATTRNSIEWITKWVHNSQAMIASGDPYAVKIYNEYNKAQMTAFPNLSEDDIKGIFAYVDQASAAPAPAAAGAAGAAPAAGAAQTSGPSDLFMIVLVALVVVMLLVLGVLLVIVTILSKAVSGEAADASKGDFMTRFGASLKRVAGDPAIRSATLWIFVLLVVKATLDGAYSVGVQQGYAPKQPISFSHKLHAGEYKIDCNYCHTGVNRGKSAHIPSANICMNCHGVIKKESPEIQKIYTSIENNTPIEWVRVHNLPDLAYFNHSQHVNVAGLECENCHGDIAKMEVIQQRSSLTMGWCIDCHRKTDVNTKDNKYYDKLVQLHASDSKEALKVADIGGLECSKCHY